MRLPYHVYATADRKRVVEETDPDVGVLLYAAGDEIPEAEAKRLGLREKKAAKAEAAPEPEAAAAAAPEQPAEEKAVVKAETEDKAIAAPRQAKKG